MVTEVADQAYVGTALTLQLAAGFTLTVVTIQLVLLVRDAFGWASAFALLAPGPLLGVVAMVALARSPYAARIAGRARLTTPDPVRSGGSARARDVVA